MELRKLDGRHGGGLAPRTTSFWRGPLQDVCDELQKLATSMESAWSRILELSETRHSQRALHEALNHVALASFAARDDG